MANVAKECILETPGSKVGIHMAPSTHVHTIIHVYEQFRVATLHAASPSWLCTISVLSSIY